MRFLLAALIALGMVGSAQAVTTEYGFGGTVQTEFSGSPNWPIAFQTMFLGHLIFDDLQGSDGSYTAGGERSEFRFASPNTWFTLQGALTLVLTDGPTDSAIYSATGTTAQMEGAVVDMPWVLVGTHFDTDGSTLSGTPVNTSLSVFPFSYFVIDLVFMGSDVRVRGDVSHIAAVPLPMALLFLLSGLASLVLIRLPYAATIVALIRLRRPNPARM
jgi:hypothetical protein